MSGDAKVRYIAALHAMQTGVMYQMQPGGNPKDTEPKHLRTGVNSALVNSSALAALLIEKGLITEDEYYEALAVAMEREATEYTELVRAQLGVPNVTLS